MDVAIVVLPLIAAALAGLFGRWIGDRGAQGVTCLALLISLGLSCYVFADVAIGGHVRVTPLFTWFLSGGFEAPWAIRVDQLTAVMLVVVTGVSAMVHV